MSIKQVFEKKVAITVSPQQHQAIKVYAAQRGVSIRVICDEVISTYLKKQGVDSGNTSV